MRRARQRRRERRQNRRADRKERRKQNKNENKTTKQYESDHIKQLVEIQKNINKFTEKQERKNGGIK